jgi:hypothetical protein
MIIYKITNLVNGKSYIGQTVHSFSKRYQAKCWWKSKNINQYFKKAILFYGPEKFQIETLHENVGSLEELNLLEISLIKDHNTIFPNGYNFYSGGQNLEFPNDPKIREKMSFKRRSRHMEECYNIKNHKTGEIYGFTVLSIFCRENNLHIPSIARVCYGERKRYECWTKPETKLKHTVLKSPEGELFDLIEGEYRSFCEIRKLARAGLTQALKHKYKNGHKGWFIVDTYYS